MANIFEQATRQKLRFSTSKGNLSTEELWDMPLTNTDTFNLNSIAKHLHKQLKSEDEVDFVGGTTTEDTLLKLKFDVVKRIIDVKLVERTTREQMEAKRQKNARIREIIARKQDEALEGQSLEELTKLLED